MELTQILIEIVLLVVFNNTVQIMFSSFSVLYMSVLYSTVSTFAFPSSTF